MGYFNHPFEIGNKVRLIDDIHLETSLSEESLASDFEGVVDIVAKKGKRNATEREVVEDDDIDSVFDFASAINKKAV